MLTRREQWLLVALCGAVVLYLIARTERGQSVVSSIADYVGNLMTPRGIRNNNPGNIIRNGIDWQGALTRQQVEATGKSWDDTFVQFDTPANGVRALGHILKSNARAGWNTVDAIIRRYSATDQDAYVANVADALGVQPSDPIDVQSLLPQFAAAIITQENGEQPYDPAQLAEWVYS